MATAPAARTRHVARRTTFRARPVGRRPTSRFIEILWFGGRVVSHRFPDRRRRANEQTAHARLRLRSYGHAVRRTVRPTVATAHRHNVRAHRVGLEREESGAFAAAAAGTAHA